MPPPLPEQAPSKQTSALPPVIVMALMVTETPELMVTTESSPDWLIVVWSAATPTSVMLFSMIRLPLYVPAAILTVPPLSAASIAAWMLGYAQPILHTDSCFAAADTCPAPASATAATESATRSPRRPQNPRSRVAVTAVLPPHLGSLRQLILVCGPQGRRLRWVPRQRI